MGVLLLCRVQEAKETPLIAAAFEGRLEVAKLLLEAGANAGAHDSDGKTALDYLPQLAECVKKVPQPDGSGADGGQGDKEQEAPAEGAAGAVEEGRASGAAGGAAGGVGGGEGTEAGAEEEGALEAPEVPDVGGQEAVEQEPAGDDDVL